MFYGKPFPEFLSVLVDFYFGAWFAFLVSIPCILSACS